MKLALVISSLGPGGAERVLTVLANAWAGEGVDVTIITFEPPCARSYFPLQETVQVRRLDVAGESASLFQAVAGNFRRVSALRRALQAMEPDVVVSFMDQTNVLTLLATRKRWPTIISERVAPSKHPLSPVWSLLRRLVYPSAAALVVQTTATAAWFSWMKSTAIIPNPVPASSATRDKAERRNVVLAAGRLCPQKGFDLLIEAFGAIAARHPGWSVAVYGEGDERARLEALVARLRLEQQVSLPGLTQTLRQQMAEAAVFCLPSRYEGFPNVLCEAMAEGAAVVAFDCPDGPSDIIQQEINGVLVPPGRIDALADALEALMMDQEKRERLGTEARQVSRDFSHGAIMNKWNDLISNVQDSSCVES